VAARQRDYYEKNKDKVAAQKRVNATRQLRQQQTIKTAIAAARNDVLNKMPVASK